MADICQSSCLCPLLVNSTLCIETDLQRVLITARLSMLILSSSGGLAYREGSTVWTQAPVFHLQHKKEDQLQHL